MKYLILDEFDIYNGPGSRVTLWVAGCPHHCVGCHNDHTWEPNQGITYSEELVLKVLDALDKYFPKNFSILGGEPLAPYNIEGVKDLVMKIKERRPETNIWLWTGYLMKNVSDQEIFKYLDVVVDGPFKIDLLQKDKYCGSTNQVVHYLRKEEEKDHTK